jgi:type IV pilus assembly protein PilP
MKWIATYIVMASAGLWFAFFMSLKFVSPAYSQSPQAQDLGSSGQSVPQTPPPPPPPQAPTAADLPPEFSQDAAGTPAASSATAPAPRGTIPPPPQGTPVGATVGGDAGPGSPAAPAAPAPTNSATKADQKNVPVAAPVMPEFAGDDQYVYEPGDRRDPFKPYRSFRPGGGTSGPVNRADLTDPLQRWDINRFTILAIIWEVRNPKAMIKDPDGITYMIGKNTKIGRNAGYVAAIREGEVVVVETVDTEGVVTKEVKILELKK